MKWCLWLLCVISGVALGAPPDAVRAVKVAAGKPENSRNTVSMVFHVPGNSDGFRLQDGDGKERPMSVMMRNGSRIEAFFNGSPGEKLHLEIYREKVSRQTAEAVSGLIHTAKRFDGRTVNSLEEFREVWKSSPLAGAGFEDRVFAGVNPFDQSLNSLHRYHGFIRVEAEGEYDFYTASTDASFLLIDGKLTASWPGRHGVYGGLYGEFSGKVNLKPGRHEFEYLHANNQWAYYAIAAWQPPARDKFEPIPAAVFTPVLTAEAGALSAPDGKALPDFSWTLDTMLDFFGVHMYQVTFKSKDKVRSWQWGDGTSGGTENIHYYFKPGIYKVVMETDAGRMEQQIEVAYRYDQKFVDDKTALKMVEGALRQEKNIGIQPDGYNFLAEALIALKQKETGRDFYRTMLGRQRVIPPEVIFNFFKSLILEEMLQKENYEAAEMELSRLISEVKKPEALAAAKLEYAGLLLYYLNRPGDAAGAFNGVKRGLLPATAQVAYDLAEADLALMQKGYAAAQEYYHKMDSQTKKMNRSQILQSGGVVINIRNCLVLKKYQDAMDYLEQLEASQPEVRLNSEMMLLRARVLKELGRPRAAAVCLERVLRLNPDAKTQIEASLELGRYYFDRREMGRAKDYLRTVRQEAPRSREAVAAEKMLQSIAREGK